GAAIGLVYLAAVRLGGSRLAGGAAAGGLAVTVTAWRAGGSGGVYGVALAALALGWVTAARFVRAPDPRAAAVLGIASGIAVGGHLANVAFVAAALLLVATMAPAGRRGRSLGGFSGGGVMTCA